MITLSVSKKVSIWSQAASFQILCDGHYVTDPFLKRMDGIQNMLGSTQSLRHDGSIRGICLVCWTKRMGQEKRKETVKPAVLSEEELGLSRKPLLVTGALEDKWPFQPDMGTSFYNARE